jgi:hypothetical protein
MSNLLLIPMRLDALVLRSERQMVEARADFTRLPYYDGKRDANPDIAYISEEIVSQPFQDLNLNLKEGIHLHWALPDVLTTGHQTSAGMEFPPAPNRWLVIRSRVNTTGPPSVEREWIVESDYLYPDGAGQLSGSANIPRSPGQSGGAVLPFRFLGRNVPLEAWLEHEPGAEYLSQLTAVGYGEPTFSAFYPNCLSVFGFFDDDYSANLPDGLQYDVLGWYSDPDKDLLKRFVDDYRKSFSGAADRAKPTTQDCIDAVKESFNWVVSLDRTQEFPAQMLCYSRVTFAPSGSSIDNPVFNSSNTSITLANTGLEALSAYLADTIDDKQKAIIEDQLESVQLTSLLGTRQLDAGPVFQEARHANGFIAADGGALWTITVESQSSALADADKSTARAGITLPEAMAHQLNLANTLQQAYESGLEDIESMRKQLFYDWYKYMISSYPAEDSRDDYPDQDEIRFFLETKEILPLQRKIAATGAFNLPPDQCDRVTSASASGSPAGSAGAQLADAINQLISGIVAHNNTDQVKNSGASYALRRTASPRYYQPNEPVVLITGPAVKPTRRHNQDEALSCQVMLNADAHSLIPGDLSRLTTEIDRISAASGQDSLAFNTWTVQPWNPFLLEWEVEVYPAEDQGNLNRELRAYMPDFITGNYTIIENDTDLSFQEGKGSITAAANIYNGYSILTGYASGQLKGHIESFLKARLLADYYDAQSIPEADRTDDYFDGHTAQILAWYKQGHPGTQSADPLRNVISAYELITEPGFYSLSQSLNGFNDNLLMRKLTMQLPVADPLGFVEYQEFADRVRAAVGDSTKSAPEPFNDFNPIRSGALKITQLRLVDTFGQLMDLDTGQVNTTARQTINSNPYLLALPPRLVQPARINFRWLSAAQGEQESNDHPATTPVCGWVLANHLDGSLMIYDGDGMVLGSINEFARWDPAPGDDNPIAKESIPNPHLRKAVNYLCSLGATFLEDFIRTIDSALENIEPENYAQHTELALLMGNPLALVRASLNLELQGLPAIRQTWNSFRQDLRRNTRDTDRFDEVLFPIRIGEYRQFNDGLVGYWVEQDGELVDDLFYAPQSGRIQDAHIKTHADDPMTIYQTVNAAPQTLMMLLDPRGVVHATSGVVPSKTISLPPDQYTEALRNIEITFLSTPILTDAGKINLALPAEPGYRWSWLQRDKSAWSEVSTTGVVRKQKFIDSFGNGQLVWDRLIEKGWIAPTDPAIANVTPKDQRTAPSLGDDLANQAVAIESILDASYIGSVNLNGVFTGRQELREGWLKLSEIGKASSTRK